MSKKATKVVIISVDEKLAHHLEQAETHLIDALELFGRTLKPERPGDYRKRLTRAQEIVTTLHREELIRKRNLLKVTKKIVKTVRK